MRLPLERLSVQLPHSADCLVAQGGIAPRSSTVAAAAAVDSGARIEKWSDHPMSSETCRGDTPDQDAACVTVHGEDRPNDPS
jgi:hypothetical protein